MNHRRSAYGIKIAGLRVVDSRFALRDDDDSLILSERIDKLDGTFSAHRER
jgi:hypothetical protein